MRFILGLLCFTALLSSEGMAQKSNSTLKNQKIRVACIGNSVTFGYKIRNRELNCYPVQLQKLLGDAYEVRNFGYSGATLLRKGHKPYWKQNVFTEAKAFKPNVVIIHLGLNDTDPRNWPNYRDDFMKDYTDLIETFRGLQRSFDVKVWVCKMTPIFHSHPRFKSGTRDWFWQIQKRIEQVAEVAHTGLIDLHTPLYSRPDLFPDALHPNAQGAKILARTIYGEITGDFGGLSLPKVFDNHMVLQRNAPVSVYGIANAGDKVTVSLNGAKASIQTNEHGKWNVKLPEMKAGGPFKLNIETKDKSIVFDDVLIGEVWLCSGQSNMAFTLKQSSTGKVDIPKANNPNLRLLNMKTIAWPNAKAWNSEVLKKVNDLEFFQGAWSASVSKEAADFSAIAYYYGSYLQKELNVPVGLILNAVGGSTTESWIDRKSLEHNPVTVDVLSNWLKNDFVQPWCRQRAKTNLKLAANPLQRHPFQAAYLFETGIDPLVDFPIKGAIWYQGESNAHNVEFHEVLFPQMVKSWRNSWGYEFPFYYVQLSGINRPSWGHFRDSQRRMVGKIPNSGMVVSSDMGHPTNVHPKNKKPIGERLAKLAMAKSYGYSIEYSGPVLDGVKYDAARAILSFSHSNGLKASNGDSIVGFEIAGADGIYYPVKAKVKGNTVILKSKTIKKIENVRYGWQAFNKANLVNGEGFPASTFSTEK